MPTYIFDRVHNCMVNKETGQPMLSEAEKVRPLQIPRVMSDIEGYQSPIDGTWVEGRRARRYDLEKNGCVDANELRTEKKFKNKRFIEKRGLQAHADPSTREA